jgi:hypothetical protein
MKNIIVHTQSGIYKHEYNYKVPNQCNCGWTQLNSEETWAYHIINIITSLDNDTKLVPKKLITKDDYKENRATSGFCDSIEGMYFCRLQAGHEGEHRYRRIFPKILHTYPADQQ